MSPKEKITCSKLEAAAFLQDLRSDLEKLRGGNYDPWKNGCDGESVFFLFWKFCEFFSDGLG